MFDVTATSNHWVLNPGRNLGLQLALESTNGKIPSRGAEMCCVGWDSYRNNQDTNKQAEKQLLAVKGTRNEQMANTRVHKIIH